MSETGEQDPQRKAALERIKSQRSFWQYLAVWAIISVFLIIIWLISGAGYFWPIWAIVGMGIAAFFMALNSYGPRNGPPSEERIQREMDKM